MGNAEKLLAKLKRLCEGEEGEWEVKKEEAIEEYEATCKFPAPKKSTIAISKTPYEGVGRTVLDFIVETQLRRSTKKFEVPEIILVSFSELNILDHYFSKRGYDFSVKYKSKINGFRVRVGKYYDYLEIILE